MGEFRLVRGGWAGWRRGDGSEGGTSDRAGAAGLSGRPPDPVGSSAGRSAACPLGRRGVEPTARDGLALSPAQALELGSGLLAAVVGRSDPVAGTPGTDPVPLDEVVVGADGRVALRPADDHRSDRRGAAVGRDVAGVGAVLADVARAARRRSPRADPAGELAGLDLAVAELPDAGISVVARTLNEAAETMDRGAVRAELGALARAIGANAVAARGTGAAGAGVTARRADPPTRASSEDARVAKRRIGAWLLSVLVLVAVVLLEFVVLRDNIAADIGTLLDAGRGGSTPSAAPKPDGLPIVPPAPAAAGSVRGVDLRPLTGCTTGVRCTVRVLVRVVPASRSAGRDVVLPDRRPVHGRRRHDAGRIGHRAGRRAAGRGRGHRCRCRRRQAVAVVAVTRGPAVAASTPVLVGSCRSRTG